MYKCQLNIKKRMLFILTMTNPLRKSYVYIYLIVSYLYFEYFLVNYIEWFVPKG